MNVINVGGREEVENVTMERIGDDRPSMQLATTRSPARLANRHIAANRQEESNWTDSCKIALGERLAMSTATMGGKRLYSVSSGRHAIYLGMSHAILLAHSLATAFY